MWSANPVAFRENGDRDTDHGRGSTYWVLGGTVKGGRVAGRQVEVSQAGLFQDRDRPVLTDYRSLIGDMLKRGYGLSQVQLQTVFPNADPLDLALILKRTRRPVASQTHAGQREPGFT